MQTIYQLVTKPINQNVAIIRISGKETFTSVSKLFNSKIGGSQLLQREKWVGNAGSDKRKVRYGFATLTLQQLKGGNKVEDTDKSGNLYFLDIPPQSIQQKEVFANNIQAFN